MDDRNITKVKYFLQNHGLFLFFLTASLLGHVALKWLGPAVAFEPQLGQLPSGRTSVSIHLIAAAPREAEPQAIVPPLFVPLDEPQPLETPTPESDPESDAARPPSEVEIPIVMVTELARLDEPSIPYDTARPASPLRRVAQEPQLRDASHEPVPRQHRSQVDLPDADVEIPRTLISQASTGADAPPGFVARPLPPYPPELLMRGVESTVFLRVTIGRDGRVDEAVLHRSSGYPAMDQSALQAVTRWVFSPARRGNEPVVKRVLVPIEFKIRR